VDAELPRRPLTSGKLIPLSADHPHNHCSKTLIVKTLGSTRQSTGSRCQRNVNKARWHDLFNWSQGDLQAGSRSRQADDRAKTDAPSGPGATYPSEQPLSLIHISTIRVAGANCWAIAGMPQSNAPANTNLENERRGFIVIFWEPCSEKTASKFVIVFELDSVRDRCASSSTLDLLTEASIGLALVEQNCNKGASKLQPSTKAGPPLESSGGYSVRKRVVTLVLK